jgi:hypothetical protein
MPQPKNPVSTVPTAEFWLAIRCLALSFVALLERTVLEGRIKIPIAAVRKRMLHEGWEPTEGDERST